MGAGKVGSPSRRKRVDPEKAGLLEIADTIIKKAYTDENGLVTVHSDRSKDGIKKHQLSECPAGVR